MCSLHMAYHSFPGFKDTKQHLSSALEGHVKQHNYQEGSAGSGSPRTINSLTSVTTAFPDTHSTPSTLAFSDTMPVTFPSQGCCTYFSIYLGILFHHIYLLLSHFLQIFICMWISQGGLLCPSNLKLSTWTHTHTCFISLFAFTFFLKQLPPFKILYIVLSYLHQEIVQNLEIDKRFLVFFECSARIYFSTAQAF